ncbi:MAG: lysine--tRNA ligase, partial [Deltaproteobacteria bacterium HGW-Deltaproteobacteria-20]
VVVKQFRGCDNHGERVFLLYELMVEPNLTRLFHKDGKSIPVFVTDHPVEVSPLARRQTREGGNPNLVDRFELFVHGRELCNAFSELNDPEDQAERFAEQVRKKERGADETMDYDEDYIRALEHGMPPTAGFGVGVDRLTMALTAQESIREVILFPLLRPER